MQVGRRGRGHAVFDQHGEFVRQDFIQTRFKAVQRTLDDFFRARLGYIEAPGEIGVHVRHVQAEHLGFLGQQLVAQRVGERPGGRLAGGVGGQLSAVHPGGDRQHIQQGTAPVVLQDGRKRLAHAQHGEEVGLEDAACDFFAVVIEKSPWPGDARVVDEQGHIPGLRDGTGDFVGLRHIQFQRLHTGQGDGGRVSGGGIDFAGTPVQEFTCKGQPNATVGARHEGYGVFNLHKKLQFKNQDFVAQGKAKPGGPCLPWALLGFALIGFWVTTAP